MTVHWLERLPPRTASLLLGLVTLCACLQSIITVVTGWYAMNLNNTHPQSYPAFYTVHCVLMRPDGQLRLQNGMLHAGIRLKRRMYLCCSSP